MPTFPRSACLTINPNYEFSKHVRSCFFAIINASYTVGTTLRELGRGHDLGRVVGTTLVMLWSPHWVCSDDMNHVVTTPVMYPK